MVFNVIGMPYFGVGLIYVLELDECDSECYIFCCILVGVVLHVTDYVTQSKLWL